MQFEGAVVKEQNVTFAVVVVKEAVLNCRQRSAEAIRSFRPVFPGLPVVLMAQDHRGRATYYGRKDLSNFLSSISISTIPWKRYNYS